MKNEIDFMIVSLFIIIGMIMVKGLFNFYIKKFKVETK